MMGAGKSTVGPALARRLSCAFVDTDREIERQSRRRIAEIFEQDGETAFRALERQAVEDAAEQRAVVALGGGAIAQPGAPARLEALGTVVYLRASPQSLLRRIGDAARRPLLAGLDAEQRLGRIRALLEEREPAYRSAAIAVETEAKSVEEVVEEICERLAERAAAGQGEA